MKPRVHRITWISTSTGDAFPRWHVDFVDSCGCATDEDFATFGSALRFAHHVANGGSRWEFIA